MLGYARSCPVRDDFQMTCPLTSAGAQRRERAMKKVAARKAKLTKSVVDKIEPPAEGKFIVWDADLAGFGVFVTSLGVKSWIINYRTRDGRQRRLVLGRCDRLAADRARMEARAKLAEVDVGGDPAKERRETRARMRMSELLDTYINDEMPRRKRASTIKLHSGQIERYIRPLLGTMAVADVTREEVRNLHRRTTDTGGAIAGNRIVSLLSAIMSHAIELGCITDNPAFRFPRHSEQPRRRYLSLEEVQKAMADMDASPAQDSADAVRLLLYTGARVGEVLSMKWGNIDVERGVWSKPAAATKQKRDHHVPLTEEALTLLKARRKATNGEWVFPARYSPTGHLTTIRVFWKQVCKRTGIPDCHIHDLRHTFASLAASQGVPLQVVGGLLGHSDHKTTNRYLHLYDDPLRAGTAAVAALLPRPGSGN